MSRAAASMYYFGYWILICGVSLLCFPGILLKLVGIQMEPDTVARLFGMVLLFMSFYYFMASKHEEMRPFYRWTTYTRPMALIITVLLVFIGLADPIVIAFVVVDVAGAAWTIWALRQDDAAEALRPRA